MRQYAVSFSLLATLLCAWAPDVMARPVPANITNTNVSTNQTPLEFRDNPKCTENVWSGVNGAVNTDGQALGTCTVGMLTLGGIGTGGSYDAAFVPSEVTYGLPQLVTAEECMRQCQISR